MKDKSILISVGIIIYIVMSGIDRLVLCQDLVQVKMRFSSS